MPFHCSASKLVLIMASLLVHHALVARSAPPVSVNPTSELGNASSQSLLLDESKLSFLAGCNNADKIEGKLCEQYRSLATTVLTQRKPEPVTVDEIQKVLDEKVDANGFCDNLSPMIRSRKARHPEIDDNPLDKEMVCNLWCFVMNDDMTVRIKPICTVLLWAFRHELMSEQEMIPKEPAKKVAAVVVVPPLLPGNVKLPEVVKNEELPVESKPAEPVAPQPNITGSEKTVPEPVVPNNSNVAADTIESGPDTAVAKPSADAAVAEKSQATIGKGATTAASNVQQKVTPKDTLDEDDVQVDANEEQNENNINDMNNEEGIGGNVGDNTEDYGDDDDDVDQHPILPQESSVKEKPHLTDSKDSDGVFSVEQPAAAAAVTIERVDPFFDQDDSNFFSYFLFMMFACIVCYVAYHNKSKLLALLVEGRRSNSGRGGFSKGRKHTAAYRKLDSNLEEAITSNASASSRSTSQIIY